jgi:hypothetical protein
MPALLLSPLGRWLGLALAVLALAGGLYACGRDAGQDAARGDAAQSEQNARREGDAAAAAAERDGAAVRLRDGRF